MSVNSGRGVGACMALMFGLMAVFMGLMLTFIIPHSDPAFEMFSSFTLWGGVLLVFIGIGLIPSARREARKTRSILEIAAVRKEVRISDIASETGLDSQYVRKALTQYLINGFLFGYIEDDLFVRDTAGRPRYYGSKRGLFEVQD